MQIIVETTEFGSKETNDLVESTQLKIIGPIDGQHPVIQKARQLLLDAGGEQMVDKFNAGLQSIV